MKKSLDDELGEKFVCAKCKATEAVVKRIATTGGGFTSIFNIHLHTFIAVSCKECGYTDLYNFDVLRKRARADGGPTTR